MPERRVRRTCDDCGFENAEPDKACPLCGASAARVTLVDLDANMTIVFGPEGKATGFGSVNQFSNSYTFTEHGQLKWGSRAFVTTRRAGPPELMQKERIYLEALGKVSRAIVKGHKLQLQSDDGATVLPFDETGY